MPAPDRMPDPDTAAVAGPRRAPVTEWFVPSDALTAAERLARHVAVQERSLPRHRRWATPLLAEYDRRGAAEQRFVDRGRVADAGTEVRVHYGWRRPDGVVVPALPLDTRRHVLDMAETGMGVAVQWEVRTSTGPLTEVVR